MQDTFQDPSLAQTPAKRSRLIREKISQKLIDEINERHDRIKRSASEIAREVVELGQILTQVKKSIRHGKWLPFVEKNLGFTDRTATRYMRAAERIDDPLLSLDPAKFLAGVWGNEPKQIEGEEGVKKGKSDVTSDFDEEGEEDENDDKDLKQHGGEGFEPSFFPDKGKPGFLGFKNLIAALERQFLGSEGFTVEAKLTFIGELIKWLEDRKAHLLDGLEEKQSNEEEK
jgi:DUF3102 family protein